MTRSPLSASVSSGASGEGAWRNDAIGSATSKPSAIARHQQRVERARRLALAAFGPSGLGGRGRGVNVEMQPRRGGGDKPAKEQRRGDRAAKIAGGDVVHVRDFRLEQRLVGPPQRHAPQRIVLASGAVRKLARERLVVGVERRGFGSRRPPYGAASRCPVRARVPL